MFSKTAEPNIFKSGDRVKFVLDGEIRFGKIFDAPFMSNNLLVPTITKYHIAVDQAIIDIPYHAIEAAK